MTTFRLPGSVGDPKLVTSVWVIPPVVLLSPPFALVSAPSGFFQEIQRGIVQILRFWGPFSRHCVGPLPGCRIAGGQIIASGHLRCRFICRGVALKQPLEPRDVAQGAVVENHMPRGGD